MSLAGNLIAAPAKFQVSDLTLPVALQVGRAQFGWIGIAEWVVTALIILAVFIHLRLPPALLVSAIGIFVIQQLWLQPQLQARSDLIVAGGAAPDSHLHLIYAVLETLKCGLLVLFAALALVRLTKAASVVGGV
ncbi:MAG: hypothetical protein AAFQ09_10995 [Pseudomonadota bacterium]